MITETGVHKFNVNVAEKYGIYPAILLSYIHSELIINERCEDNFIDGKYWMHNPVKKIGNFLVYMSDKQIRTALEILFKEGVIEKGDYNKSMGDRAKYYTVTTKGYSLLRGEYV